MYAYSLQRKAAVVYYWFCWIIITHRWVFFFFIFFLEIIDRLYILKRILRWLIDSRSRISYPLLYCWYSRQLTKSRCITSPPGYNPSQIKKKRARLTGDLLPYKKSFASSIQKSSNLDELETPIPMDATPDHILQLPAKSFFKASKKKKQIIHYATLLVSNLHNSIENLGDLEVSWWVPNIAYLGLLTCVKPLVLLLYDVFG